MKLSYLVRYGIMSHVARFTVERDGDGYERGQSVVVRTERGLEIGESLGASRPTTANDGFSPYAIVRSASDEDRRSASGSEVRGTNCWRSATRFSGKEPGRST